MSDRYMSKSLHIDGLDISITPYDDDFVLLHSAHGDNLSGLGRAIFEHNYHDIDEVIVTPTEICLKVSSTASSFDYEQLNGLSMVSKENATIWKLPICFDMSQDWSSVEAHANEPRADIIERLCAIEFTVGMFGFISGFVYMHGLPEDLQIPRKKVPAKYIESNSIAIGGPYIGLYSLPSPGGWHVIGRTPISILQLPEIPPVKIQLKDGIKMVAVSAHKYQEIIDNQVTLEAYNNA